MFNVVEILQGLRQFAAGSGILPIGAFATPLPRRAAVMGLVRTLHALSRPTHQRKPS